MRPVPIAYLFIVDIPEDTLITREYEAKIHDFKNKFKKARQDFSDSLQVEIIKGIHWIGR